MSSRSRIRDLGYAPGQEWLFPGSENAITDVPGVQVGTYTRHEGVWDPAHPEAKLSRTGITIICPRPQDAIWTHPVYASIGVLNGTGEMTNSHMIKETGYLYTPLALTDTLHVGAAHTGILKHLYERVGKTDEQGRERAPFYLPCVAETSDCLSTPDTFHLEPENVLSAFDDIASSAKHLNGAPRPAHEFEGVKGGGTGMLCLGHKGGNGTSSRLLPTSDAQHYTIGCFVQCNFGAARDLTIGGAKIGRRLCKSGFHGKEKQDAENALTHENDGIGNEGSILVVLATDAPLLPYQLDRLLRRIPIGLARTGCASHQYSGDIGLAFSTQTTLPPPESPQTAGLEQVARTPKGPASAKLGPLNLPKVSTHAVQTVDDASMNLLFYAVADVVEEAVLNALCAGTDQEGADGFKAKGLDHDIVAKMLKEEGVSK